MESDKQEPRPDLLSYRDWAKANLGASFDKFDELLFSTNVQKIKAAAVDQPFFRELPLILDSLSREFEDRTGARLFAQPKLELVLETKPYGSALEKSYRANVVRNKQYPSEPKDGWVVPSKWYGQLNDLVRGTLVCGYVDALPWLAGRLQDEALRRNLEIIFNPEVRDEGYYAFHVYARLPKIALEGREGDGSVEGALVEIQLTTQLQDALREVTHFYYEKRRLDGLPADWKWLHGSSQFRASYISHALHLVDALIVELRSQVSAARGSGPAAAVAAGAVVGALGSPSEGSKS